MSVENVTDSIIELLDETQIEEKIPQDPVRRRKVQEIPDALVLFEVTTVCSCCGTRWPHPNIHILGRYGRRHRRIRVWSSSFEYLPREREHIWEKATGCQNCFDGMILRTGEMENGG